ncbi:MAG TPA: DNA methyltransferase [Dictyobacter sp.]|nr:DNA methyltransferase [Dictyobacter sp.]
MFHTQYHTNNAKEYIIKHFYTRFKVERVHFISALQAANPHIEHSHSETYATLILLRLMFLYFLQKKEFLNHDPHYLLNCLKRSRQLIGEDTFYHSFLLPLLHEGFSTPHLSSTQRQLFGTIPYLGATLFSPHPVEQRHPSLVIPDQAFEQFFAFFETYQWQSGEYSSQFPYTVTPDILGSILEQYINQQHMGAYYTQIDVTEYVASNTIIPSLFDAFTHIHPDIFSPQSTVWQQLQQTPDRYIYDAIRQQQHLPGETTREYQDRQNYYQMLSNKLRNGTITSINDFVTYNLNIRQFAYDTIQSITKESYLQTCYQQLLNLSVLDPTCGSGAFLLAALHVLYPLYQLCLKQMKIQHLTRYARNPSPILPANHDYKIIETILVNNLYGVDIMPEAVESCKLRLYLSLLTHSHHVQNIPPLPDLNRTIHVGNALVNLVPTPAEPAVAYKEDEEMVQSFSWQQAFPTIFKHGGFRVIIGNPPYVEYSEKTFPYILTNFVTRSCSNLYTCIIERSHELLSLHGRQGMILPLAAFATRNMQPFLTSFRHWFPISWVAFFHFRPAMLFSGGKVASIPTAIYLAKKIGHEQRFSTSLIKWSQECRSFLFHRLTYNQITTPLDPQNQHYYPKFGHCHDNTIMQKIMGHNLIRTYIAPHHNHNSMFYRTAGGLYWKIFVNFSWPYHTTSNKKCCFIETYDRDVFVALFNSSLFWWYYTVTFDTFNLKDYMLFGFRFTYPQRPEIIASLRTYSQLLMDDFCKYARHLKRGETGSYTIYARKSKSIIDAIDTILAQHYGFTDEELEFILHYDIKYRMGQDNESLEFD